MGAYMSKFGDWVKAGIVLQALSVRLQPMFEAQFYEDGNLVLEKITDHILAQDLSWQPLSQRTIRLKGGNDDIYIETGYLLNNLEVRKVKSPSNGFTLFVGASAWKTHPESGKKLSDIMIWLEYGTDVIPPRPVIRPSFDEVRSLLEANWKNIFVNKLREEVR
jgi:hypothetical protein